MWWVVLIGITAVFGVLGLIYGLLMHHNKYYFWKFATFVPDRNGARKPGEKPAQNYGNIEPTAKNDQKSTLEASYNPIREELTPIELEVDDDGHAFRIRVGDGWLTNGGLRIRAGGQHYSSRLIDIDPKDELSIKLLKVKAYAKEQGSDHMGPYTTHLVSWYSVDKDVLVLTTIRHYEQISCVMFRIEFPTGLTRTFNEDYTNPCIEFPVFNNESNKTLIFTYTQTNFSEPSNIFPKQGTSSPLMLYNEDLETMIFSPTMNFLTAWQLPSEKNFEIRCGLEGNLRELPENFVHENMLFFSKGIARSWDIWGQFMLQYYQKGRQPFNADWIVAYLGYWTDAGTTYYYNHQPYQNYEELLLAVNQRARELNIPYRYWQLDSWFYPKDDGTLIWEPDIKYFPNGLAYLSEKLGGPFICHNRWFSVHTQYKSQYSDFITEEHVDMNKPYWDPKNKNSKKIRRWSFPTKIDVWRDLMEHARSWNCVCYEQDWLQPQWRFFDYLRENVYSGRQWLKNMSDAAAEYGLTLQYCMTYPSFYLQTLELPNVTHARCSDDYNHLKSKRIYVPHFTQTAMLSWALGIFPWKDPFFSTCIPEPGSISVVKKTSGHYEQWAELEFLMQVLSAGPVGNGDAVENLNKNLLMQSCREDGLLIKPDRPIFPIDLMFLNHNKPYICLTYSTVNDIRIYYLLEILIWSKNVLEHYVTLEELGLSGNFVLFDYFDKNCHVVESTTPIGKGRPLNQNEHYFAILAPILSNGMAWIGLRDKIATMSNMVFSVINATPNALHVEGYYLPRTEFAVTAYIPQKPKSVKVNGTETTKYTWGNHFQIFTIILFSDEEKFSLDIEV